MARYRRGQWTTNDCVGLPVRFDFRHVLVGSTMRSRQGGVFYIWPWKLRWDLYCESISRICKWGFAIQQDYRYNAASVKRTRGSARCICTSCPFRRYHNVRKLSSTRLQQKPEDRKLKLTDRQSASSQLAHGQSNAKIRMFVVRLLIAWSMCSSSTSEALAARWVNNQSHLSKSNRLSKKTGQAASRRSMTTVRVKSRAMCDFDGHRGERQGSEEIAGHTNRIKFKHR